MSCLRTELASTQLLLFSERDAHCSTKGTLGRYWKALACHHVRQPVCRPSERVNLTSVSFIAYTLSRATVHCKPYRDMFGCRLDEAIENKKANPRYLDGRVFHLAEDAFRKEERDIVTAIIKLAGGRVVSNEPASSEGTIIRIREPIAPNASFPQLYPDTLRKYLGACTSIRNFDG